MPRSQCLCPAVSQFGWRGYSVGVIDQGITEPDPQLRIARIASNRILQNVDRILALAVAGERFGDAQPAFRRREIAEEGMARLGQRENVARLLTRRRRARQSGSAL